MTRKDLKQELVVCFIDSIGPVTEVKTDIYVTSFGPVSDVEMVRTLALNGVKGYIHIKINPSLSSCYLHADGGTEEVLISIKNVWRF